jgi:hypothetical protein
MRTRAERRHNDWAKAIRKRNIVKDVWHDGTELYDNLHQYSKNKVHCSCHLCSCKTNNKGKRRNMYGNYAPAHNPSVSDMKKIERMDYEDDE